MHDLTEADAFTTPVSAPDGSDSRSNAAEVVEAIAQALANRTNHLNLHAAFIDVANVFTLGNTFQSTVDVQGDLSTTHIENTNPDGGIAALVVRSSADDDSHSGNKYKNVGGFILGGGLGYCNLYTGTLASEYQFVVTLNGVWDTAAQHWHQDDATHKTIALLYDQINGKLRVSEKPSSAGTWTTWPVNAGDLDVGGVLTAHGDSETGGAFKYITPPTRTTAIPLADAQGKYFINETAVQFDTAISSGDFAYAIRWPIRPIAGAIGIIEVRTNTVSSGGADVFWINQRRHAFSTGIENNVLALAPGTTGLSGGKAHSTSGGGLQTITLIPFAGATDGDEYELVWQVNSIGDLVALASNQVIAIARQWSDIGPSNNG